MTNVIRVVFAPDANYAAHAGVAIFSILQNSRQPRRFHFDVLESGEGFAVGDREKLCQVVDQHSASLAFKKITNNPFADFKAGKDSHLTAISLYRLLVPSLLADVGRCLYLDSDLIVLGDLAELWDEGTPTTALAAAHDLVIEKEGSIRNLEHNQWREKHALTAGYFNAGVLDMNLHRWRERDYARRCLELADDAEMTCHFADQDVLNLVFRDDITFLHPRWNIQTEQQYLPRPTRQERQQWRECVKSPGIAHFTGREKPWDFCMKHYFAADYWRLREQSPWRSPDTPTTRRILKRARLAQSKARLSGALKRIFSFKFQPGKKRYRLMVLGWRVIEK